MHSDADLTQHADDIAEVLDQEQLGPLHVLGWCNGGRIAIELATRGKYDIRTLTLLSPTLRGTEGASKPGSPFEDRLQQIFTTVTKNQALAMPLVKMLARFTQPPDWDGLAGNPSGRAAALFALPSRESAATFLVPMSAPPLLINYARRTAADEAYPMANTLRRLGATGIPVLLISGSHDSMVSNQATCTALANGGVAATHATVAGAGHYIQDLQYPYFLWLLRNFADNRHLSSAALRVDIQHSHNHDSVQGTNATT
jgi:pimeloyl-ACP methyl ester carboxylesterase